MLAGFDGEAYCDCCFTWFIFVTCQCCAFISIIRLCWANSTKFWRTGVAFLKPLVPSTEFGNTGYMSLEMDDFA